MKNVLSFLTGAMTMLLLVGLPVTALAVSGAFTIEVSPSASSWTARCSSPRTPRATM